MKISSFMDSVKSPELSNCFASNVAQKGNEMMKRLDEFVRADEAYALAVTYYHQENHETSIVDCQNNFSTGRHRVYRALIPQREQTNMSRTGWFAFTLDSLDEVPLKKYWQRKRNCNYHHQDLSGKVESLMKYLRPEGWTGDKQKPLVQKRPLIIEAEVEVSYKRAMLAKGSSVEVMFEHCFENLPEKVRAGLRETRTDLVGFAREGPEDTAASRQSYLHSIDQIYHSKGIATLIARTITIDECRLKEEKQMIREETPQEEEGVDVTEQIIVNPSCPDQMVTIGGRPSKDCKEQRDHRACSQCKPFPRSSMSKEKNLLPKKQSGGSTKEVIPEWIRAGDSLHGYHNPMAKEDEEKTTFYTEQGTYCYTKMSFGLKNAGATYQGLVDSTFQNQIGRNLEAYVDDMVIKSKEETSLLADIAETFESLKIINMKLNPKKCSFGVEEGKFLGYMVTSEGIRANPKKTRAISDLQSPKTLKEMQSLSGKLASLNRFLAKSAERALPFFNTLKNITKENKHEYRWTPEAEEAFQQMKRLIMSLPSLTPPFPEETLYAYLAVSKEAVSAVLLTDRNGRQCPVQYVSRTLNEAERNYSPLEKLALSLINMTRRLRRYFEAHPVKVITDQPIKNILSRTEASGKLAKYAVEIGTYKISFIPRNAVKGQVLADFLSDAPDGEREDEYFRRPEVSPGIDDTEAWTLYTDGAASSKGSGAGFVLTGTSGVEYAYALRLTFASTNNEAEYEALLAGLRIARRMNVLWIKVKVDSKLVASQVQEVQTIVEEEGDNWMTPIIKYLEEGIVPSDKNEARALRAKIGQYTMESGVLFKKGYLIPMLRRKTEVKYSVTHAKVIPDSKTSENILWTSIMARGPFYQWGMDILGPLTPARGGAKFVIVAIDYFTKWVEAKPLVKITGKEIIRFVMDNIICRYGLPRVIVTDNGAQLEGNKAGCVDEFPNDYGAHRHFNPSNSNGETPLQLTYESEAGRGVQRKKSNVEPGLTIRNERKAAAHTGSQIQVKIEQYYNRKYAQRI
ncbi:reverse transcriptase domain-containing protein [Tanacetum coccineum]|uniref:Reverse transcriptase domain-containing protein n=1 Tax=Tanacetum coccineum TaxID=301880 RepID=A0ABQ5HPS9_9ASTR